MQGNESITGLTAGLSLGPGDVLGGKYRIDGLLAEGGMGVVLLATHLDLACPVVIKLIAPEHAANEELVARLLAEARIAASLRSKHVNRVLDVGRTEVGTPYLVLEYMEGHDLSIHLERCGRLTLRESVDHVLAACEALAEAHALGIVHRDLKPENLFLSEDAEGGLVLKVFDFGISKAPRAKSDRRFTNQGEIVGSPCYMSPEQIRGGNVDGRSDIWALGVLLHELCSGEVMFDSGSMKEIFAKIIAPGWMPTTLELGPGSEQFRRVVAKCLERSPDDRYQTVAELAEDLAPLGSDPSQAACVARVAAAARARVVGMTDSAAVGSAALLMPSPSTSPRESTLVSQDASPTRPRSRWLILAAAAIVLLGAGSWVNVAALRSEVTAPDRSEGKGAIASPPRVSVAVTDAEAERLSAANSGSELPVSPAHPARAEKQFQTPAPSRVSPVAMPPPPVAPTDPASAASTLVVTLPPVSPSPSTTVTAADPWNSKTFGGRR